MESPNRTLFGWPGYGHLAYAYGVLGPSLMAWFVLIYGSADYLTGLHDVRVRLHLAVELGIPFVPAMVVFYNSMHVAYLIAPFILRTRAEIHSMGLTLVLITLCGGVVFLLLPSELAFAAPPESALGPWRGMFRLADQANLRFNLCPSLHVAWGIICVDIYAQAAGRPGWLVPTFLWSWGIGILLSTLLLHQHHLIDAVGGAALALLGSRVLYPRFLHRFQRGEV